MRARASTVIGLGADIWRSHKPEFGRREIFIVGFSVFLCLGLSVLPAEFWVQVPPLAATVFSNPVIAVIIVVMALEQLVFRQSKPAPKS